MRSLASVFLQKTPEQTTTAEQTDSINAIPLDVKDEPSICCAGAHAVQPLLAPVLICVRCSTLPLRKDTSSLVRDAGVASHDLRRHIPSRGSSPGSDSDGQKDEDREWTTVSCERSAIAAQNTKTASTAANEQRFFSKQQRSRTHASCKINPDVDSLTPCPPVRRLMGLFLCLSPLRHHESTTVRAR